ncbi:MAG: SPOR domain-containing protein [Alphaproteobacteria bacterium]|nr:SPOR domain-containing protein [Alphaproteobacteria bacterium]
MAKLERGVYDPAFDEDELETFDATEEEEEEGQGRNPVILILGILVLLGFAAVVWLAYDQGSRQSPRGGEPPVLAAEDGPVKVPPESPGGTEIPYQDKVIYDRVTGETAAPGEQLLPPAESPKPLPETTTAAAAPPPGATQPERPPLTTPAGPGTPATGTAAEPAAPAPVSPKPPATAGSGETQVAAEAAPVTVLSPAQAPTGAFVVQVGAFESDALAADAFERIKGKNVETLRGLSPSIQRVDLANKGIWYRLRVGAFATKDEAAAVCKKLKANGQDCLVAKN